MYRQFGVGLLVLSALAASLRAQSPSPLFRVLEEHVPYDFRPLTALDVDVDGDQDLICREGVLLNDGTGRFSPTPVAPTIVSYLFYSVYVARADLDGDGFDDLMVRTPVFGPGATGVQLTAFASTTGGLVQLPLSFPVAVGLIAAIDYDEDGDDDLLVGGAPSLLPPEGTQIWENQNGVAFAPAAGLLPATGVGPTSYFVAAGDYDGDGDVDAFSLDLIVGSAKFFLRAGTTFSAVSVAVPGLPYALSGALSGDFDGDGADDVVLRLALTSALPAPALDVGLRCAGGAPTATLESSLYAAAGFAALDLNGDGALDRAFSPQLTPGTAPRPSLEIRPGLPSNAAAAPAPAPIYSALDGPVVNLSFDVDGDGDLDLVCTRAQRTPRVLYNDGAGGLYEARGDASYAVAGSAASGSTADVVVGDFDGDGDVDLARFVNAGCAGAPVAVLRNDGHGRFPASEIPAPCVGGFPIKGLAADFDGDGRSDILRVAQIGPPSVVLHRSTPADAFTVESVAVESGIVTDFAVRDHDGDGDVDAAACFAGTGLLVRYLNDGTGAFARAATSLGADPTELRIVDQTGDSVPDFVVATALGVVVVDGATLTVSTLVAGPGLDRVDVGDLDADGDVDLLVDGQPYLRQAGGVYFAQPSLLGYPVPNAGPSLPQSLLDVDDDGDLDALAYGSLWRNAFGAFFGPEPVPFPTVNINQIAQTGFMPFYRAADFDRDGDVDLLDPTGRLIANISRHLSRGAPAAIGRVGTLDVCGPPLQPFALFASANAYQQNPYVVPGWGNLFLVPDAAVYVGLWSFDANAGFGVPFAVPNVPALVGLDLYWQAVLPVAGRITNVERTRILSL